MSAQTVDVAIASMIGGAGMLICLSGIAWATVKLLDLREATSAV